MPRQRTPFIERFLAKVPFAGGDGCWEWLGSTGKSGYGAIGAGGKYGIGERKKKSDERKGMQLVKTKHLYELRPL